MRDNKELLEFLHEETGRSTSALANGLSKLLEWRDLDALRAACDNDAALVERVKPFAGLLRPDTFGRPVIITTGSIYVTSGTDRRSSGTHYTPRSLTEPIVQHTLDPLVYHGPAEGLPKEQWTLHPAERILALQVCDMAMGSGAFLVQACRYLAERLAETAEVRTPGGSPDPQLNTLFGLRDAEERLAWARRLVADRCLYGVDKNPLAVEMAKLSLWLITLQKDRPFSFLDHALRAGDSLLGIAHVDQLLHWSLARETGPTTATFLTEPLRRALQRAITLRRKIREIPVLDVRDAERKTAWLHQANEGLELVKLAADLLVAASFQSNPKRRKELSGEFEYRMSLAAEAFETIRRGGAGAPKADGNREELTALRREADDLLQGRTPFHWPLEFPEVFIEEAREEASGTQFTLDGFGDIVAPLFAQLEAQPLAKDGLGFAAIIGNPPFRGGKRITEDLGTPYRDYMVEVLAIGKRGNADLCAYFFLRAYELTCWEGIMGLLATNTISQGDTREVGLDQLCQRDADIIRAIPTRKWPGDANLEVAQVWLRRGGWYGAHIIDEKPVSQITSLLNALSSSIGMPHLLNINEGRAFKGSVVLGMGFILLPSEAAQLIEKDPRNSEILFPYLNGEDLNSRVDQSPRRWVINFRDWPLERAELYPDCLDIVREKVKPEREQLASRNASGQGYAKRWWQHGRLALELYQTVKDMKKVLVIAQTGKYHSFVFISTNIVFDQKLVVFTTQGYGDFTQLQSTIHRCWVLNYGSTLKLDPVYASSDCFENYPFLKEDKQLASIGADYYAYRQNIIKVEKQGLTKIYNRFHDPGEANDDIAELRRLHVVMDQTVAAAYGWADLDLGHGFHQTKQGLRYTISEPARRTVLDRLLTLNHQRYAEEVAQGLHDKGVKKAKGREKKVVARPAPYADAPQLPLDFDEPQLVELVVETPIIDFQQATEQLARKRAAEERELYEVAASLPQAGMETTQPASDLPVLDRNVIVLARTIEKHQQYGFEKTLGHVKAEKILHIVEAHGAIDLGRSPTRMAAGPADFDHLLAVAAHGKKLEVFQDIQRSGDRKAYQFIPLPGLEQTAARMEEAFGPIAARIDDLIERFVGLDTDESEIVATLYAAWNDLLAAGEKVNEERLFKEFYAWDESKGRFQSGGLRQMKAWMESWGIVPSGKAKRTVPRGSV